MAKRINVLLLMTAIHPDPKVSGILACDFCNRSHFVRGEPTRQAAPPLDPLDMAVSQIDWTAMDGVGSPSNIFMLLGDIPTGDDWEWGATGDRCE
jgi:hypothetical protein